MLYLLAPLVVYFTFYSFFWLYAIAQGLRYQAPRPEGNPAQSIPNLMLVLPSYRPGTIFSQVLTCVESAIKGKPIGVMVLLQEAKPAFFEEARSKGFQTIEKTFSHLPGNSYHHALAFIANEIRNMGEEKPDYVMILNKDNLLPEDFFDRIPAGAFAQYDLIQARRTGVNQDQAIAFFDQVSETLNDVMFRAASCQTGHLLEISGSGALVRTTVFLGAIDQLDAMAPGYDKNMMVHLATRKPRVRSVFLPSLEVY
jgi:hypothetical protein